MPNRYRMNTKFLTYLVERLYPSQCLQSHLRLELGSMELSLLYFTHLFMFLGIAHSLNYCLKIGVHRRSFIILDPSNFYCPPAKPGVYLKEINLCPPWSDVNQTLRLFIHDFSFANGSLPGSLEMNIF